MPWGEPEPETAIRLIWIGSALMLLLAIVSIVGELVGWPAAVSRAAEAIGLGQMLGWWNFVGEVGTIVGTLGSLLLVAYGLAASAGRGQLADVDGHVRQVHDAVLDNGRTLTSVDVKLTKLDKLDALDRVQVQLDEQTGVLEDIRDLL